MVYQLGCFQEPDKLIDLKGSKKVDILNNKINKIYTMICVLEEETNLISLIQRIYLFMSMKHIPNLR